MEKDTPIQKKINNNRDKIQMILQSDDFDPKDKYEFIKELARRNDVLIKQLNEENGTNEDKEV